MFKPKSNSFHSGDPKSCEVENASLKMRNLLLEDAITKLSKNPADLRHSRNQSVYSAKSQMIDIPPIPQPSNAELLAKLYNSNRALENTIMKLNSVSAELNMKEEEILNANVEIRTQKKGFSDLKELVKALKIQNKQLSERQDDQPTKFLQSKLSQTLQYNEQLFSDYQKILRQNQHHQCQILEQQEQIVQLKVSLKDNELALQKALSKTENKVQHLEQDLDRLELKQNQSIPDYNKKVKALQSSQQQNFDVLESCSDYINSQLLNSIVTLKRQIQTNSRQFCVKNIQFRGLQQLLESNNDKGVQYLVQKMNISQLLQTWLEQIFSYIMIYVQDQVVQPIQDKIHKSDRRLLNMQDMVGRLVSKLSEGKQKKVKKQSFNSSFVNYSTIAQSTAGHSVRKQSSFVLEKENQSYNKSNCQYFEENFEKKLIEVIDNCFSKISQNQESQQKSFKKFKKLPQSPQSIDGEIKKLYDLICQQASNNDLVTTFLVQINYYLFSQKKEFTSLKQDLSCFIKQQRSAQLPKML